MKSVQIAMIGTGYVGLVSGACFAALKHQVVCIDNNAQKIAALRSGEIPIYEPELDEIVHENIKLGRLCFETDLEKALKDSEAIFLAVGTPTDAKTGQADLTYLKIAIKEVAHAIGDQYKVIVIKSTVPVGTCHWVKKLILEINPQANFDIVSNPEFLREGFAVYDFMNPDRVVIGIEHERPQVIMNAIYQPFANNKVPLLYTDLESSELIKYTANCFLAMKIAFINEIANVCERTGANIKDVSQGLGLDHRIGLNYLNPGPGFGGSCFPKDTLALTYTAREIESPLMIMEAVIASNERRKNQMVHKIVEASGGSVDGKRIAVLGVAFKANTDDIRESSSLIIIEALQKHGATLVVYDPVAMENAAKVLVNVEYANNAMEAIENADVVVIATEWPQFKDLEFNGLNERGCVVDLRNLLDFQKMAMAGVRYISIGQPHTLSSSEPMNDDRPILFRKTPS